MSTTKDDENLATLTVERDEEVERHPSYGMIGIYRTTGGGKRRLFGSSIADHQHTIHIRLVQAERRHGLGRDWYYGSKQLVDIELSAMQFAEFVTTPNTGNGVPCTIRYLPGKDLPSPPDNVKIEVDKVQDSFKKDIKNIEKKLENLATKVNDTLDKKNLGVKDRDSIRTDIAMLIQKITSDLPFMVGQFAEATEKITNTAKAEIEAFTTNAVLRAGLAAIAEKGVEALPEDMRPAQALPPGDPVE